ncbi:MAG: hypothetical protein CMB72_02885 [Euryarchaeota archaeon]|nr:hypothetical protein [Euryarchaeota archaeon]|tara:strand:+ start:477 stop:896 length:420 start_codon:yes stop_codon:yes gene_type:complete
MNRRNSLGVLFIASMTVVGIIGWLVGWNLSGLESILEDVLIRSLMAMTVTWVILATSSTGILHRGKDPRTLFIALLLLSVGGLGLTEIVSGGLPEDILATLTVQWVGLAMSTLIVLFTVLAIITGREFEEDQLLAMDES